MQQPTLGRIVHYVFANDGSEGVHNHVAGQSVPAMIVAVWSPTCVNLILFLDGSNHGHDRRRNPDVDGGFEKVAALQRWVTSRTYSEGYEPGTWHWPPREEQPAQPPDPRGIVGLARGDAFEVPEQLSSAETKEETVEQS